MLDHGNTESRLAAIERQLSYHRAIIAALLVALVVLLGLGATEGVPDVVRARKFEVVNSYGKVVVSMEQFSEGATSGGQIGVRSNDGLSSTWILSDAVSSGISIQNRFGDTTASLATNTRGGYFALALEGEVQMIEAKFDLFTDSPVVELKNKQGGKGVRLFGNSALGRGGGLQIYNTMGEAVVEAYPDKHGFGVVGVYNRQGKGRTIDANQSRQFDN